MKNNLEKRIEFKTTLLDYKLIVSKATESGFSISEYCRRTCLNQKIDYKLNPNEIEAYLLLQKYANNFTRISNLFKKKDPELSAYCRETTSIIREQLKKF